ncbi:MAG: hypothetical protein K0Q73_5202 [Paenibacillus sp.]|jgi:hypothetical protein|nr:hypothetical protein [Paenibacillus sp.]
MSKDHVNTIVVAVQSFIRDTSPTEDEYIQLYLRGVEDALQLVAGVEGREVGARRHTA